jgi:nitroreductase
MEFTDVIKGRRSIRKFKDKPIEDEKLKKLIEIIKYVPTAHNMQDYFVYIVKNQDVKEKIAEAALSQNFVAQAPLVFVVCAEPGKEGTNRGELYSLQGSAMVTYTICLQAYELLLGSVWVGLFKENELRKAVGIPKKYKPVAIIPVGYPAEDPKMPQRREDYFEILE